MNMYRIYALVQRYMLVSMRELGRIFHIVYFPLMDIVLWGYMSIWMQRGLESRINLTLFYLLAVVLWDMIWAINNEQSQNLLEELESRNIVNLFSTPVTMSEWVSAGIILSVGKALATFFFGASIVWLFYGVTIFSIGWVIIPFSLLLMTSGLALGFFLNGILIRGGQQIAILIWSIPYLVLTFSAVFYPVALLPHWLQHIAKSLPTTYVFEAIRHLIEYGFVPRYDICMSVILNMIYFVLSVAFFIMMFNKSKARGLAELEQR